MKFKTVPNRKSFVVKLTVVLSTFLIGCKETPSEPFIDLPTVTQSPIVTSSSEPTHSVNPTKTPIPTLTSFERERQVEEWLKTNAGCKLPCWWGIEPGKVSWNEVNEFLNSIGSASEVYKDDGMTIHESKGINFNQQRVTNVVSFVEDDGLTTAIIVKAFGYNNSLEFKNIWQAFSPENIILEYGVPSRVWIKSGASVHEGSPGPTAPYSVWLFYDHLGILVRYDGQVNYESTYKMCPAFSEQGNLSDYIYIYLRSPEVNTPIETLSDMKAYGRKPLSLEEAAGMSPNEFYELFTKPNVEPCFETPRSIWP